MSKQYIGTLPDGTPHYKKDWTGSRFSANKTLGSSDKNAIQKREVNDYYATPSIATKLLIENEHFSTNIWEPACGEGHISKVLKDYGYEVYSTDLIDRNYGNESKDFLSISPVEHKWMGDIVTNPPYKYAQEFIEKALELIDDKYKVAMFLKLTFVEGKKRKLLFKHYPPKVIYVSSSRINCLLNGKGSEDGGAVCYAWFVWEKGYKGDTVLKWIN